MQLVANKKLGLTYVVTDTYSAGIELLGHEVKALRGKLGSLEGAKVLIRGAEAYAVGIYIPPYQPANTDASYDPYRTRKLLLTKEELRILHTREQSKTLTLIPISLYIKNNLVKCDVGVCKKKDTRDKREDIKKDVARREMRATQ